MTTREPAHPDPASSARVATRFLDALGRREFGELASLLAPDVWVRALLPRRLVEAKTAVEAAETFRSWYGGAEAFEVLALEHHTMANREYIRYRFRLRPEWAPDQWHLIEQVGYCRVKGGRVSRIDMTCTGYHPIGESEPRRDQPGAS